MAEGMNRRRFLETAAASGAGLIVSNEATEAAKRTKEKSDESYDEAGGGPEELFIDQLIPVFKKIDKKIDVHHMPSNVQFAMEKYLDDAAKSSRSVGPESRTRAVDAESLWFALKRSQNRKGIDRRIPELLTALLESALHIAANDSTSSLPEPVPVPSDGDAKL